MKTARTAAILLLAFLFGGGGAEVAVQTHRALERQRAARAARAEGSAGELVALQIEREDGSVVARPRVLATPGRAAELVLRDPEHPGRVRLALRVETTREASGHLQVAYLLSMRDEGLFCRGRVHVLPGEERRLDVAGPLTATLVSLPVPSAAFDAFLQQERAARRNVKPT